MASWTKMTLEENSRACKMDRLGKPVHKGEGISGVGWGDGLVALHQHCVATIYLRLISMGGVTGLALKEAES
jgi:hypothetical protein